MRVTFNTRRLDALTKKGLDAQLAVGRKCDGQVPKKIARLVAIKGAIHRFMLSDEDWVLLPQMQD